MRGIEAYRAYREKKRSMLTQPPFPNARTPNPFSSEEAERIIRFLVWKQSALSTAYKAFDQGRDLHTGTRTNGEPAFSHQVAMAIFFLDLHDRLCAEHGAGAILSPEQLNYILSVIFLHDSYEDGLIRDASGRVVSHDCLVDMYGKDIGDGIFYISKIRYHDDGTKTKLDWKRYSSFMLYGGETPAPVRASLALLAFVKGIDRLHNLSCCFHDMRQDLIMRVEPKYWTAKRVRSYEEETTLCHIPMLTTLLERLNADSSGENDFKIIALYVSDVLARLKDLTAGIQSALFYAHEKPKQEQ